MCVVWDLVSINVTIPRDKRYLFGPLGRNIQSKTLDILSYTSTIHALLVRNFKNIHALRS